jgi:TRAP-type C4-dicarboxylate transport system substrate-binding protein
MKNRFWTVLTLSVALLVFVFGAVEARTLKLSHVRPQDTAIDKDLNVFAKELKDATAGKLAAKIYPASALGDYTVVQERVGLGAVDMACQPPGAAADKRFQITYFPYMVMSWDQARKNYSKGAPLRQTVGELYAKQGIRLLAAWPVYFGGISLNREVKSPGDPNVARGSRFACPR